MILLPDPVWPTVVLAVIVFGDGLLTLLPPRRASSSTSSVPRPLTCGPSMSAGISG